MDTNAGRSGADDPCSARHSREGRGWPDHAAQHLLLPEEQQARPGVRPAVCELPSGHVHLDHERRQDGRGHAGKDDEGMVGRLHTGPQDRRC